MVLVVLENQRGVPKNEKFTEKIEGDADTIVAKLMDILKNKLKVI